jgi:glycerophosphoryl diester phosphodiesterase
MDLLIRKLRTSSGLRERAVITSFSEAVIERVARDLPEVRSALLTRRWPANFKTFTSWAIEHHLYGIGITSRQWSPIRVEQAHAIGLKAFAWEMLTTRSTPSRAQRLKEMKIDVAIVNQPEIYLTEK